MADGGDDRIAQETPLKLTITLETNLNSIVFPKWVNYLLSSKFIWNTIYILLILLIGIFGPAYLQIRLQESWLDHSDCNTVQCHERLKQHIKYGKMVALAYDMFQSDSNSVNYLENVMGNDDFSEKLVECVTPGYDYQDDLIAFPAHLESTADGSFFGFVATNKQTHDLAIAIRGTVTKHDIVTDLKFYGRNWDFDYQDTGNRHELSWVDWLRGLRLVLLPFNAWTSKVVLHGGFYDIYRTSTRRDKRSLKDQIKKHVEDLVKKEKIKTITITGHSLGAAISTIVALEVAQQIRDMELDFKPEVRLVTFANPLVGNKMLWKTLEELAVSDSHYFNIGDSVPWLPFHPLFSYTHGKPAHRLRLTPAYYDIKPEEKTVIQLYIPFVSTLLSHNLGHILYNIARIAKLDTEVGVSVLNKYGDYLDPHRHPNQPKSWYNLEKRYIYRDPNGKLKEWDLGEETCKTNKQFNIWAAKFIKSYASLNGHTCASDFYRKLTGKDQHD